MASTKISALPGASTLTGAETIPLVQGGTTKKVTTDQFLIKDASGNVGIGTASPVSKVHVEQVSYTTPGLTFSATAETSRKYQLSMVTGGNFALTDTAAAVQRLVVDTSGNLLVGDTSASGKLHVTNTNNVSGDTAGYFALGSNTNNASSYFLQCVTSGVGGKAYILGNGDLQNANNSYGAFSDVKLKENITDASPKLSKLMQVRIVNYTLKSDPDKAKLIGVVAQELEQFIPGLIEETADFEMVKKTREVDVPATEDAPATTRTEEYTERVDLGTTTKSVKYSVFVPMLIKGMQEQQAQIEALEARLAALEAK